MGNTQGLNAFVNWVALLCSSWISTSCGTTCRSFCNPHGFLEYRSVWEGNLMAARCLYFKVFDESWSHNLSIELGQPFGTYRFYMSPKWFKSYLWGVHSWGCWYMPVAVISFMNSHVHPFFFGVREWCGFAGKSLPLRLHLRLHMCLQIMVTMNVLRPMWKFSIKSYIWTICFNAHLRSTRFTFGCGTLHQELPNEPLCGPPQRPFRGFGVLRKWTWRSTNETKTNPSTPPRNILTSVAAIGGKELVIWPRPGTWAESEGDVFFWKGRMESSCKWAPIHF